MIETKKLVIVIFLGLAAVYTLYKPPSDEPDAVTYPEYYWYNEVTGKTQWEEPIYEYESEDGETYWIDPDTGKATWEKPASLGWILAEEPGGKIYYWNDVTESTQWDKPANLAWQRIKYEPQPHGTNSQDDEPDNSAEL